KHDHLPPSPPPSALSPPPHSLLLPSLSRRAASHSLFQHAPQPQPQPQPRRASQPQPQPQCAPPPPAYVPCAGPLADAGPPPRSLAEFSARLAPYAQSADAFVRKVDGGRYRALGF
ncbi:hypothetical protein EVG20_g7027, partial [Dentipellis fragilis]